MNSKKMFGVEHCYKDGSSTYEIFETFDEAQIFCENEKKWTNLNQPLYIFEADFNTELIFKENSSWNYDDFSDTILRNYEKLKTYHSEKSLPNFVFN